MELRIEFKLGFTISVEEHDVFVEVEPILLERTMGFVPRRSLPMISSQVVLKSSDILVRFFAHVTGEIVLAWAALVVQYPFHDRICGSAGVKGLFAAFLRRPPGRSSPARLFGTRTWGQILFHVNFQTNAMSLLNVRRNFVLSVDHCLLAECTSVFNPFGWLKAITV